MRDTLLFLRHSGKISGRIFATKQSLFVENLPWQLRILSLPLKGSFLHPFWRVRFSNGIILPCPCSCTQRETDAYWHLMPVTEFRIISGVLRFPSLSVGPGSDWKKWLSASIAGGSEARELGCVHHKLRQRGELFTYTTIHAEFSTNFLVICWYDEDNLDIYQADSASDRPTPTMQFVVKQRARRGGRWLRYPLPVWKTLFKLDSRTWLRR